MIWTCKPSLWGFALVDLRGSSERKILSRKGPATQIHPHDLPATLIIQVKRAEIDVPHVSHYDKNNASGLCRGVNDHYEQDFTRFANASPMQVRGGRASRRGLRMPCASAFVRSNVEPNFGQGLYRPWRTGSNTRAAIGTRFRHDFFRLGSLGPFYRGTEAADENAHDASGSEPNDDSRIRRHRRVVKQSVCRKTKSRTDG